MYGDQFGEFVCGYWDLKGEQKFIICVLCHANTKLSG